MCELAFSFVKRVLFLSVYTGSIVVSRMRHFGKAEFGICLDRKVAEPVDGCVIYTEYLLADGLPATHSATHITAAG